MSALFPSFPCHRYSPTESIKWFIEEQAFSPSNDLAPTPPPLPSVSSTGGTQDDWEWERQLADRRGGGGGGGAKSYDG